MPGFTVTPHETRGNEVFAKEEAVMGRKDNTNQEPLNCGQCLESLQEYLDGTMEKKNSLQVFLHLRECPECQDEHDQLGSMFLLLDSLPDHELKADFDEKVLASVNYDGYRAMESIRRERIPVYLEEEFLPAFVRSRATRLVGGGLSAVALMIQWNLGGPQFLPIVVAVGLVPELLVRLQGFGRRALVAQQSES
jgi:anti-sigma factor RsiW